MNYNSKLRNILYNHINSITNNFYITTDNAIIMYTQLLYEIFDINNPYTNIGKILINQLLYSDAYKVNNYIHKRLLTSYSQIYNYYDILNIIDYDDLNATISADPNFFINLLKASYSFYESNGLTKVIMTKSLSESDNQKILSIAPIHQFDLKAYDKTINLEDIIINYKNQNKLYTALDLNFEQARVEAIYGFIKELSTIDLNNTKDILKKIAKIDNRISIYLKDKVIDNSTINEHINIYSKDNFINELLYNKDYLIDAIWMVIDACINHNYHDIKLDESLTNDILKLKRN